MDCQERSNHLEGFIMSILADHQIEKLSFDAFQRMITPFADGQLRPGVISYGVSSYGYDIRVGNHFKVFDSYIAGFGKIIDPKSDKWHSCFTDIITEDHIIIPPNSFCLAESFEMLEIPRNVLAIVVGKSTLARCGIICNVTPLEPEWRGKITIEISNTTPLPAKIYANEGIAQVVFFESTNSCKRSYRDKKGVYQDQKGLTLPKVK